MDNDQDHLPPTRDADDPRLVPDEGFVMANPPRIGRYSKLRELGGGGFGIVYLGYDDQLDRPVAIKVPRPDRVSQPSDVEAYLKEAQLVANLHHPHIVQVYDSGRSEDGWYFVVSQFMEGGSLAARIKNTRYSPRDAAELVADVAEALHHAHQNRIVHRDIKPANILLDGAGKAYLADFGLALQGGRFRPRSRNLGYTRLHEPRASHG